MQRPGPAHSADTHPGRHLAGAVSLAVLATAVYFAVPVPGRMREVSWELLFSSGMLVLALLIVLAIRRLLRAGEGARIRVLALLLVLTVLFFSWCEDALAALPGQFAGLTTKIDGLYFNISTLSTVGFGDVHAIGQLARAAVTVQIVFNLVFIGAAVGIVSGALRSRATRRLQPGHDGTSPVPDGQDGAR
ncbi:MAG TPA: potassium channel family protein [Streptosporangiaceae bacterium]|nr:potassium channel family protein [Streptosporangiaceae bacterium]